MPDLPGIVIDEGLSRYYPFDDIFAPKGIPPTYNFVLFKSVSAAKTGKQNIIATKNIENRHNKNFCFFISKSFQIFCIFNLCSFDFYMSNKIICERDKIPKK